MMVSVPCMYAVEADGAEIPYEEWPIYYRYPNPNFNCPQFNCSQCECQGFNGDDSEPEGANGYHCNEDNQNGCYRDIEWALANGYCEESSTEEGVINNCFCYNPLDYSPENTCYDESRWIRFGEVGCKNENAINFEPNPDAEACIYNGIENGCCIYEYIGDVEDECI